MRDKLWLTVALVILAVIAAPNAHADLIETPTFTCTGTCLFALPFGTDVVFPGPVELEELWNNLLFIFELPAGALPGDTYEWINSIGAFVDNGQQVVNGVVAIEDVTLGPASTESIEYETGGFPPLTHGGEDRGNITFAEETCGPGLGCTVQGLSSEPIATFTFAPEPSSMVLLGTLLAGMAGWIARGRKSSATSAPRSTIA